MFPFDVSLILGSSFGRGGMWRLTGLDVGAVCLWNTSIKPKMTFDVNKYPQKGNKTQ